ncbi:MAG: DMT family transporter [Verrucomicrobiae bacterium]|nr:DMT family transporter [Verrucomicrobiae bacterium]
MLPSPGMFAAGLATLLFALSSVSAKRSVTLLGPATANLARMTLATLVLALLAHGFGVGLGGPSFGWFVVSGIIGFGICDTAIFLALPRLGAQLTSLMVQCLAAPIAAVTEWCWLGTRLPPGQWLAGCVILAGVALALAPGRKSTPGIRVGWLGLAFGAIGAAGQAWGAVLSRHGQLLAQDAGYPMDGISVAYQRILAGLVFTVAWWFWMRSAGRAGPAAGDGPQWRPATPWVLVNALSGPSLGVAAYQWALQRQATGVVMAITALTPLAVIPLAWWLDQERPSRRSVAGGLLAVGGVVWLALHPGSAG